MSYKPNNFNSAFVTGDSAIPNPWKGSYFIRANPSTNMITLTLPTPDGSNLGGMITVTNTSASNEVRLSSDSGISHFTQWQTGSSPLDHIVPPNKVITLVSHNSAWWIISQLDTPLNRHLNVSVTTSGITNLEDYFFETKEVTGYYTSATIICDSSSDITLQLPSINNTGVSPQKLLDGLEIDIKNFGTGSVVINTGIDESNIENQSYVPNNITPSVTLDTQYSAIKLRAGPAASLTSSTNFSWYIISDNRLSGLVDVNASNPAADDVLKYDGTNWVSGSATANIDAKVTEISAGSNYSPVSEDIKSGQHHYILNGGGSFYLKTDLGTKSTEFVLTNQGNNTTLIYSQGFANVIYEYGLNAPSGYSPTAVSQVNLQPKSTRTFFNYNNLWYEKYNASPALPEVFTLSGTAAHNKNLTNTTDNYKSEAVYRLNPDEITNVYLSPISLLSGVGFKYLLKNVSSYQISVYATSGSGQTIDGITKIDLLGGQSLTIVAVSSSEYVTF